MGTLERPERLWVWPCFHGGVQVEHGPVPSNYPCHECGAMSQEYVRADTARGAVAALAEAYECLTDADTLGPDVTVTAVEAARMVLAPHIVAGGR